MPELIDNYRRIAIVMLSAVGDAVHVLPVANALKRAAPNIFITWVIQPLAHQLVYNHPAIDEFILLRRSRGLLRVRDFASCIRALRRQRFDLVIALQVYFKAGILTAATRSPVKLGFDRARARDLNWLFTTHHVPAHAMQHIQDEYFEFLTYLGIDPNPVEWGIVITEEERKAQRQFFDPIDRPVCAVVVGTTEPERNWPAKHYARLFEIVEGDFGHQTIMVGGASPTEAEAAQDIMRRTRAKPLHALGNNLRPLVYLIDGSDVVVSPDTGPLHIARALEVPVIGLYGYTNPKRAGPYRKYQDLIVDGYARYPGEDYPANLEYRSDGMQWITVEAVAERFELATKKYTKTKEP
ncbi:MAG: glycosyltransferase family 9 protein [Gammaproteobacteria bacterium]|nr:glycosyltransferase family 9 protein [Gammaproteobacteria bacterium]